MIDKTEIKNTTGLVWFGNDLRIHDNDVLSLAVKNHTKVIGAYIIDPLLYDSLPLKTLLTVNVSSAGTYTDPYV